MYPVGSGSNDEDEDGHDEGGEGGEPDAALRRLQLATLHNSRH